MPKLKIVVVVDTCAKTAEVKCVEEVCEEKQAEAVAGAEPVAEPVAEPAAT